MANGHRSIFRDYALKQYIQRQERDVLPRLVSPPTFVFYWMLLGLLLIAGCVVWWEEVPTYVAGSGIMLESGPSFAPGRNEATALVFLPANSRLKVQIGLPIQLQIGMTGPRFTGQLEKVEPGVISPAEAYRYYPLGRREIQVITQPSTVLIVRVGPPFSSYVYAGSIVHAQVPTGSQRVLSLLPGLNGLIGG